MSAEALREKIREIPDFPKPGILFYDITTLLKDPAAYKEAIDLMLEPYRDERVDIVVGMESRGFIFSAPMASATSALPERRLCTARWKAALPEAQALSTLKIGIESMPILLSTTWPGIATCPCSAPCVMPE